MRKAWFTRTRRFYKPSSLYGWLITVLALAYIAFSVVSISVKSLKMSETLVEISLRVVLTAVLYSLIAYATQKPKA